MILNSLNAAQQEAVQAPLGHQLVLAGAGSGKTRVLTHRIAWLIEQEKISPLQILAVTFTNKAANEMRSRIEGLLKTSVTKMWIGTFHGLSHRFLRSHWHEANLPQSFQILDSDDQFRMIRRAIHSLNLDESRFPAKEAQWFINAQKEAALSIDQIPTKDQNERTLVKIYQTYQEACERAGVIDFTDLLLKTYQLLLSNEALRLHYQNRFRCLLVDEFQDTNKLQYAWLKLFAGEQSVVTSVGDDDQSIYGWRGACVDNLEHFRKDFSGVNIIRLEQNYRSTNIILKAANAIISQNTGRMGKNLWTEGQEGKPIAIYAGFNETDEAYYIANRIRHLQQGNYGLSNIAILYRSNMQSRVIEEELMRYGIPYRVYGGLRYFDRQEIKDALAYLRLLTNHSDDTAFERIINTPTRGIGDKTVSTIRDQAKILGLPLWQTLTQMIDQKCFGTRTEIALRAFIDLINNLSQQIADESLPKQVEYVIQMSGLIEHYRKEKGEKAFIRLENLEELVNAADHFIEGDRIDDGLPPLSAFLAYAALEASDAETHATKDSVQLMTLHSAKGLEFPVVFLAGCEEELFPHYLSMNDPKALEEERRLCYVGVTRAMHELYMTYAEVRHMHGKAVYHRPSRFLDEIPCNLTEATRFRTQVMKAKGTTKIASAKSGSQQNDTSAGFRAGKKVHHHIFGNGIVLTTEGEGENMKVTVKFSEVGIKVLIASFLKVR